VSAVRFSPRWRKLVGDARASFGRLGTTLAAMAVSIAAIAAILTARSILDYELVRNYRSANPASAVLSLDTVDDDLLRAVRDRPDIAAAESAAVVSARIEVRPGEWMPLWLFVAPDFAARSIDRFSSQSGAWPPPPGAMLIERSGLPLTGPLEGKSVVVETAEGRRQSLLVAGLVHDAGQAPSTQEFSIYGYITPATLAMLEPGRKLDQLKIVVRQELAGSTQAIEAVARPLGVWLRENGREVHGIDIPPPGKHPHQWQYDAVSLLLLSFSLLGLLLEAVLMAIIVAGLLAPQVRQIAVMKVIGARRSQIVTLYLSLVAVIALVAVAIGVPVGLLAGGALVKVMADLVNLLIESYAAPWWVIALSATLGIALPVAAALVPVLSATRRTVRESLDDHGVASAAVGWRLTNRLLAGFRNPDPTIHLAIRNTVRRATRSALAVSLLSTAGIVFLVAGNLLTVWNDVSAQSAAARRYDMEIYLRQAAERSAVLQLAREVPGVRGAEPADSMSALLDNGDHLAVTSTESNIMRLMLALPQTTLLSIEMTEGRWLRPEDSDAIVLNGAARTALFPNIELGDSIDLLLNNRPVRLRVVGIAYQSFSRPAAFTTAQVFDAVRLTAGQTRSIVVALTQSRLVKPVAEAITQKFAGASMNVRNIITSETRTKGEDAHVYVLIALIGIIVLSVAGVGTLGLASALSTSVVERTCEIGIMRALGARSGHVIKSVVTEAISIGVVSWLIALALSTPLTLLVVDILRSVTQFPLRLAWSWFAAPSWLAITLLCAVLASVYPAKRAARLTVGKALSHT
jgi:putative ABC transport system permease protein